MEHISKEEMCKLEAKRSDAIFEVECNCSQFRDFMYNGIPSFTDRIPSFSSSIIFSSSGGSSKDLGTIVAERADEEDKDREFVNKMTMLLSNLREPFKEIFTRLYVNCEVPGKVKEGLGLENTYFYQLLKDGYHELALLDCDIDYSFQDSNALKRVDKIRERNKKVIKSVVHAKLNDLKALILNKRIYLKEGFKCKYKSVSEDEKEFAQYLIEVIRELEKEEQQTIYDVLTKSSSLINKTSNWYRKYERASLKIALYSNNIDYSFSDFQVDIKTLQNKRYKTILKNIRLKQQALDI